MLTTLTRVAKVQLNNSELAEILATLSASGWTPAILESKRKFISLAGLKEESSLELYRRPTYRRAYDSRVANGDVFFRNDDVYFLINGLGGNDDGFRDEILFRYPEIVFDEDNSSPELEIGLITTKPEGSVDRLAHFGAKVEDATSAALDEQKSKNMKFSWVERTYFRSDRLERTIATAEEQSSVSFAQAELKDEELVAANVLVSQEARQTLIELSRAVFAREKDIFGRGRSSDSRKEAVDKLVEVQLVNREYLLECRRTGSPLTRLRDPSQLSDSSVGYLICPACNSKFEEENISEGYSVSGLGRKMIASSHWMTVWVTEQLNKVGISPGNVRWNLAESGEEVDLLAHFLGQLWIFELKDREFGAGDAYPLNYRQARYRPDEVFVVTTEKVARDAKRVFEEAMRESRRDGNQPVYVEGLDAAEEEFGNRVNVASVLYASQRLQPLSAISGYDLGAVLTQRTGQPYEILETELDDIPF